MPIFEAAKFKNEAVKTDLKLYIHEELSNTIGDRTRLETKWANQIADWRAALPSGEKDFPWPGASDLVVGLVDMHHIPVYADMMQTLHAPEDYWTPQARRADTVPQASPLREFLSAVERSFLNMRQVNGRALIDNNILGTAVYKVHQRYDKTTVRDYNELGVLEKRVRTRYQPIIDHVPLQYFYLPGDAWNIDPDAPVGGARWCGQKFYLTLGQFDSRVKDESPSMPRWDKTAAALVRQHEVDQQDDRVDKKVRELDEFVPFRNRRIELFEIHVRFDADDDGSEEDLVLIWHQPTMSILRATLLPLLHGRRPFHNTVYLPGMGFYGMGLAEQDEWAQLALTKLLNFTIDNAVIANTRMYAAPQGSSVVPGEPIYPGKIWLLPPGEQMQEVKLGEVYPSMFNIFSQIFQLSDRRSGVNEMRSGDVTGLPSRTPATTILSILREGNKRFDMILSGIREVHSEMGLRIMQLIAQDYKDNFVFWDQFAIESIGPEDWASIQPIFDGPIQKVETEWGVSVTATSGLVNKEVEKQAFVGLSQLMTQMNSQLLQLAMLLPQLPPGSIAYMTAESSYVGGVEMLKRLLERFDIQNPSDYLPNLSAILGTLQANQAGVNPAMTMMQPQAAFDPGLGGGAGGAVVPPQQLGGVFGF